MNANRTKCVKSYRAISNCCWRVTGNPEITIGNFRLGDDTGRKANTWNGQHSDRHSEWHGCSTDLQV